MNNALPIPKLFAIDNRGVAGMDHCFGAPFIAKDFVTAQEMVKEAVGDKKDLLNLDCFFLVLLGSYDITAEDPIGVDSQDVICVADLFAEEESEVIDE